MSNEYYEAGEEIDFEKINEQFLKTAVDARPHKVIGNLNCGPELSLIITE